MQFYAREKKRAIQMKVSDLHLRLDFQPILATHLRMIHELGAVNQQHQAENEHRTKVLQVRRVMRKSNVATHFFAGGPYLYV